MKCMTCFIIVSLLFIPLTAPSASESLVTRTEIKVTIPDYDHLPIMDQLFYMDAAESQESPVWSPDGKTIAFNARAGMGIWTVPAEGGMATLIHSNFHEYEVDGKKYAAYGSLTPLAFSSDGTEIFFHDWSLNAEGHYDLGNGSTANNNPQIKVVNIETGEVRTLIKKAGFGSFTSDSRICVYAKYAGYPSWAGIFAYNLETGEEWLVTSEGQEASLSADETEVFFSVRNNGITHLKKIPLEGGESEFITNFDEDDIVHNPVFTQCAPDGNTILFSANYTDWFDTSGFYVNRQKVNYHGLCLMNLETDVVTRITPDSQYLIRGIPRFSPDGTKVIFGGGTFNRYIGILQKIFIQDLTNESINAPIAVENTVPDVFTLNGNYPNPFNPTTTIDFALANPGNVNLAVYSITGQLVRELVNGYASAGNHSVIWDGLDINGNNVSSGIYLYRLTSDGMTETKRMTLLR